MRTTAFSALVVIGLLGVPELGSAQTVVFVVVDRGNRDAPIAGVDVSLLDASKTPRHQGITNSIGEIELQGPVGQFIEVQYEKLGFNRRPDHARVPVRRGRVRIQAPLVKYGADKAYYSRVGTQIRAVVDTLPADERESAAADELARVASLPQDTQALVAASLPIEYRDRLTPPGDRLATPFGPESRNAGTRAAARDADIDLVASARPAASRRLIYEVVLTEDQGMFKFGTTDLPDEAKSRLDQVAAQMKADPTRVFIEIEGHTDNVGSKELNEKLGMERAEAVKRYLYERHQVPLHRINVISYGEEKPVATNNQKDGRAQNRRVVVKVLN